MSETVEESILRLLKQGNKDLNINCFRCGVCCRYGVSMGSEDAEVIRKQLGLPLGNFLEGSSHNFWTAQGDYESFAGGGIDINWLDELDNYRTRRNDGGCIFLKSLTETNEVRCSIHPVRPPACRGYAPSLDREACQTGLRKMWRVTVTPALGLEGSEDNLRAFYEFLGLKVK